MERVVAITGNSVALLMAPPRSGPGERTYGEVLRARGFSVVNAAKQAATAPDVFAYLDDEVLRFFPDFFVVHFGIVECSMRARPRWLQHWFDQNDWCNSLAGTPLQGSFKRSMKRAVRAGYRESLERLVYGLRLHRPWISPARFEEALRQLIVRVQKHCPVKRTALVGLTPVTEALERRMPGTAESAGRYDAILERVASDMPGVVYISLRDWQDYTVDGIHLNAAGHARVAEELLSTFKTAADVE